MYLSEKAFDASLIAGIGSGLGETLRHFLALDTTSFYECLYIVDDKLLTAQIVNKSRLVKNFFNVVSNILNYFQGANYVRLGRLVCAIDFLSGRERIHII